MRRVNGGSPTSAIAEPPEIKRAEKKIFSAPLAGFLFRPPLSHPVDDEGNCEADYRTDRSERAMCVVAQKTGFRCHRVGD